MFDIILKIQKLTLIFTCFFVCLLLGKLEKGREKSDVKKGINNNNYYYFSQRYRR